MVQSCPISVLDAIDTRLFEAVATGQALPDIARTLDITTAEAGRRVTSPPFLAAAAVLQHAHDIVSVFRRYKKDNEALDSLSAALRLAKEPAEIRRIATQILNFDLRPRRAARPTPLTSDSWTSPPRASESWPSDSRPSDSRASDSRASDSRPSDSRASEPRASEPRASARADLHPPCAPAPSPVPQDSSFAGPRPPEPAPARDHARTPEPPNATTPGRSAALNHRSAAQPERASQPRGSHARPGTPTATNLDRALTATHAAPFPPFFPQSQHLPISPSSLLARAGLARPP